MSKRYWLMKSEPEVYSIDDLKSDGVTCWEGVRNYQARNFMRDEMQMGDFVFFYHSNSDPPGIAGVAQVSSRSYPDPAQFDAKSRHYDPKSSKDHPRWHLVDLRFVKKYEQVISLDSLKRLKELKGMPLLQKGQRLSVQPVSGLHWRTIERMMNQPILC